MNLLNNKRAELATIILIILIIVLGIGWLISLGSRECRSNADCGNGFYCGSDFSCHQLTTIEKTIIKNNLLTPSIIIGIAIIIAAMILRLGKKSFNSEQKETNQEKTNNPLKMP